VFFEVFSSAAAHEFHFEQDYKGPDVRIAGRQPVRSANTDPIERTLENKMKKTIHPTVRQVVFKDVSRDFAFLGTSTMDSKETIKWEDGKTYPLIKVEISSASHPFFTGKQRVLDTEGRVGRFKKKYAKKQTSRR